MLVDTHAHVYSEYYNDIKKVEHNSIQKCVTKIVNCSTNFKNLKEVIDISNKYKSFYCALGIHPEEMEELPKDYVELFESIIKENLQNKKMVAIGEIGLDYHFRSDNKKQQIEVFESQLKIAEKYKLPVLIHSRDATEDVINILKKYKLKGIIHCFSGSLETAKEYIKLGYYIGIGGVVTFRNCKLKDYIEQIGISNIVLETDSPYMSPHPYRGEKNEPSGVQLVAKFLGEIFNISENEIAIITTRNAYKIFDFK